MTTRPLTDQDVLDRARNLEGRPFHPQGRGEAGIDCIALIALPYGLAGGPFDRTNYDVERAVLADLEESLAAAGFERTETSRPADVLVFADGTRGTAHCGIRTDRGFIHVAESLRVREVPLGGAWAERLVASYRMPGLGRTIAW